MSKEAWHGKVSLCVVCTKAGIKGRVSLSYRNIRRGRDMWIYPTLRNVFKSEWRKEETKEGGDVCESDER